jgi:DNA-binding transcriptional LysR family regulator
LPRGHLRVHAFPVVAADHLAPALPDFLARYPHITFDFMVTNRVVDLVGENVDISLRIGPLEDSGLVSRKIVDLRRVVCASPGYLARHGWPAEPADLARHACLILSRNPGSASWSFRVNGKLTRIDVKGPISADSAGMLLHLAIGGAGIVRLSEHVVARSIHEGLAATLAAGRTRSGDLPVVRSVAAGPSSASQGEGLHRFSDRAPWFRTVANRRRRRRLSALSDGYSQGFLAIMANVHESRVSVARPVGRSPDVHESR